MARRDPLVALDELIAALSEPLSKEDRAGGWNRRSQETWLAYFTGLRRGLKAGRVPEGAPYHLARWLDHDGIADGPIAERVYEFQDVLYNRRFVNHRFANRLANLSY